ncbi:lipase family protein, partial [Spongiactinospora gelatinilytica]|uniref:lipase family protein n=1 Tax=Spongiactinospora gelatinilytica TaxID=2666298 RepID=UPI001F2D3AEE
MTARQGALLRAAARELVEVAVTIQEAAAHATEALADGAAPALLARAPAAGVRAERALTRAVTDPHGLGYSPAGGRLATLAARLGALAGAESLAVRVLASSLRLRIAAVALDHPELTADPILTRLIEAAAADRDIEAMRAMRALVRDRGVVRALSALAPVLGEVLALRALLDENPLNDATAWLIATGKGYATADPLLGLSNRAVAALDRGAGAARRAEPSAEEAVRLGTRGSLLDFLGNIGVLGSTGRALIQSVEGPDGVVRHVVHAPGIRARSVDDDSPQDILGAFSSSVLDSSPYTRALAGAIGDYGIPEGAEIALIGHSAGGAAVLNLAHDPAFCARYAVTHIVAVGSPIDFKTPADPRTWVTSVTNQHDIVPTLDGQGAGACADLHPDWYVVDYTDPTHLFPVCHSIEHYLGNLAHDLPEARDHIDARLAPYRGPVVRAQTYLLLDGFAGTGEFPFLTVPTYPLGLPGEPVEAPVRCRDGGAVTAWFAADAAIAALSAALGTAGLE